MMFASGVTSRSGYLDCASMNDLPMNCSGNMRHLIVEAVKANFYNQSKVSVVIVTSKRSTIVVSSLEDEDKDGSFNSKRGYSKCKSRDSLEIYAVELRNLAMTILGFIAKALKMEANDMKELFEEGHQAMRMNYYPPCPQPDQVIGLTPHSDAVGLTILLQVNEMEGLQIRKDGMWVPIKPLPGAFIVNIGDILEVIASHFLNQLGNGHTQNLFV
ncbi:unnamed protein product, partial [Vitis vinifera]|uniref:Fe2OG dioxygenase domain-containing protein n=1 Tax=Vitis vinifera TaxID=29760 RepID=D7TJX9_VITVI